MIIDDIVLYDEAASDETKAFPKRLLYTGWFDTGKQGQEWPGSFEIVPHEAPRTWKFARSVKNPEDGVPWLRISLRGERPYDKTVQGRFRYKLTGADSLRAELWNTARSHKIEAPLSGLKQGEWAEARVTFDNDTGGDRKRPTANELRFVLPAGATLEVDDVLLYEE